MDNSDNGGAEPHKAFAKDVPKMINLDEKVQKKSTNSKDSIVKTARKKFLHCHQIQMNLN